MSMNKIHCVVHWIVIYPVDSAIHLLNIRVLVTRWSAIEKTVFPHKVDPHLLVQGQCWPDKKSVWSDNFVTRGFSLLKSAWRSKVTMESFPSFKVGISCLNLIVAELPSLSVRPGQASHIKMPNLLDICSVTGCYL